MSELIKTCSGCGEDSDDCITFCPACEEDMEETESANIARISKLEALVKKAKSLIKLSQTRLSTTPCENGRTLGENYEDFLKEAEDL